MTGSKIIQLKACGVTVKDTFCFIPLSVEKFPKTFSLHERKKGYFPYRFDTTENRFYSGPWPAKEYYTPDQKKPDERKKFLEWYEKQKNKVRSNLLF